MNNQESNHVRRVRYSGTHPKKFKEKYKELNPEKYQNTIEKIIQKGNTPIGTHRSICVNEIMDFLQIQPGQIGMDATLGYGGHSSEILQRLNGSGHLYGTDIDPIELAKTIERLKDKGFDSCIFTGIHTNFSQIDQVVAASGPLDFVLADLGVSSMQIDNPDRGFSFKTNGPLDLRLNPLKGLSAKERLYEMSQDEIAYMLWENSDEPYANEIAKSIINYKRKKIPLDTTTDLRKLISDTLQSVPPDSRECDIKKSCQRTFQAIRIDINDEFEVLYTFLEKLPAAMASNGRIAILTFHSGEDRLVKKAFKQGLQNGVYKEITPNAIRPSAEECNSNGRARSAKLRWAIRS